jgi:hypothetical protein
MRSLIIILTFLFASTLTKSQVLSDSTAFIKKVLGVETNISKIIYTDRLEPNFLNNFKRSFAKTIIEGVDSNFKRNTFIITEQELQLIQKQLIKFSSPYWTENLFYKSILIKLDTLNSILEDKKRGWKYFHKYYGNNFCQFTDPIFLRNKTICIIQYYYKTDDRNGRHELCIYKKSGNKWRKILLLFGGSFGNDVLTSRFTKPIQL